MAFDLNFFSPAGAQGRRGASPQRFVYISDVDTVEDMVAVNYFLGARNHFEINDIIRVIDEDFRSERIRVTALPLNGIRTEAMKLRLNTRTITFADSPYQSIPFDDVIYVDATDGDVSVLAYNPAGNSGRELTVKKIDESTNFVTTSVVGGLKLDQDLIISTNIQDHSDSAVSDDVVWRLK